MKFVNVPIVTTTAAVSLTSAPIDCSQLIKASFQIDVGTGSADGSVQIQVSNDNAYLGAEKAGFVPTNWSNLGSATAITTAGPLLIAQQDVCYRWIRAVYTAVSGTSPIVVTLMALSV